MQEEEVKTVMSCETGAELHTLTGAMRDVHNTLGGGNLPTTAPPFPHASPLVRPPQSAAPPPSQLDIPSAPSAQDQQDQSSSSALSVELQTQLKDTQTSLLQHVDKICVLKDALKEQEAIRHEVRLLRDMMDAEPSRNTMSHKTRRQSNVEPQGGFDVDEEEETDAFDNEFEDDSQSMGTAVPHELEGVDEEDEESASIADDESLPSHVDELDLEMAVREEARLQPSAPDGAFDSEFEDNQAEEEEQPQELRRPRAPEPSHLGMGTSRSKALNSPSKHSQGLSSAVVDELTTRLTTLSTQLESALALSSTPSTTYAQSTISALESKVEALESLTAPQCAEQERESLISMVVEWKKSVEGQWSNVQEEWNQEREQLNRACEEWEIKVWLADDGLERIERKRKLLFPKDTPFFHGNGDIKHGLVIPPSSRSLSSDSNAF
ncbi:hypothetical protein GG344DRAFT_83216 [Lentinula edodes]|nr:hypothetical protein GG344DRAFT_83216 [Lentinula edodes]